MKFYLLKVELLINLFNIVDFSTSLSDCTPFSIPLPSRQRSRDWRTTGWRLGAAAAFLHYLSIPHVPPPLRQTARYLLAFFRECCRFRFHYIFSPVLSTRYCYFVRCTVSRKVLHCQYGSLFHYLVGLYYLSVRYSIPLLCLALFNSRNVTFCRQLFRVWPTKKSIEPVAFFTNKVYNTTNKWKQ